MFSSTRSTLSAGLVLTALSLSTMSFAQTIQESSGVVAGPVVTNGPDNNAVNGTYTYNATGGYALGSVKFSGTLTTANGSFRSEARLRVTAPNGSTFTTGAAFPGFPASVGTATVTDFTILAGNFAGITPANIAGNWTARFWESFDDGGTAVSDGDWTNFKFDFYNLATPTATDLGTFNYNGTAQAVNLATGAFAAGEVKWYKFNLAQAVNNGAGRFLDIFTDVTGITTPGTDSEIGLYDANGGFITTDDDDGVGNYSELTYGLTAPVRTASGGVGGNGRDGSLAAGTYYLAVGAFNTSYVGAFGATSTGPANNGYNLRLRAAPAPSSVAVMALGGLMPLMAIARRRRATK